MSIFQGFGAIKSEFRTRVVRWILSHRIRARNPTMICDPTAIWDYSFAEVDRIKLGKRVVVCPFAEILVYRTHPYSSIEGSLEIGDGFVISTGCNIRAAGGAIRIGREGGLGQHTVLVAANHGMTDGERWASGKWDESRTGITLGNYAWVGANCTLLPGTSIGDGAVIAAGSVVRGTVPPNELWGGVPARPIKQLESARQQSDSAVP